MTQPARKPGVIRKDELYTYEEAKRRLRIESYGFRQMKRAGMKVRTFGRRNYVLGKDVIEFFESLENENKT
jgi:hypothetical protein